MEYFNLTEIPKGSKNFHKFATGFKKSRKIPNPFSGCMGALSGISVKIRTPDYCDNPAAICCRKNYYAIAAQAIAFQLSIKEKG